MPFKLDRKETLFPIPLWRYSVDNHADLNRRLLKEIMARRAKEQSISNSHRLGWQSERDLFERSEPAHVELCATLQRVLVDALKSTSSTTDWSALKVSFNGWININPPRGYIGPHMHPNALISGAYYVDLPDGEDKSTGGEIEFISPHAVSHLNGLVKSLMLTDKIRIQPKPGLILLFPGLQMHWVLPNHSRKDRVTVAFNLVVARKHNGAPGSVERA
jgi:uncharacterized protein (TIGR02466 family)